jgi:adenine phosphoribosyltransferase
VPPRSWPRLAESLERAPVLRLDDYDYFVHPLSDGVAPVERALLEEATQGLQALLPDRFDVLLAPEAMGLPLATALTLATRKPFLVARKRSYGLPGEVAVGYATGYAAGRLHLNGLRPGQEVVIVDDVVSKGGTLRALADGIRRAGARLVKVVVLFDKSPDLDALARDVGAPIEALLHIRVHDGRVQVLPPHATARLPT